MPNNHANGNRTLKSHKVESMYANMFSAHNNLSILVSAWTGYGPYPARGCAIFYNPSVQPSDGIMPTDGSAIKLIKF